MISSTTAREAIMRILNSVNQATVGDLRRANPSISRGAIADALWDLQATGKIMRVNVGTYRVAPVSEPPRAEYKPGYQSSIRQLTKAELMRGRAN